MIDRNYGHLARDGREHGILLLDELSAGQRPFARRAAALGQPGWARYSRATGLVFFAAFAGIAAGSGREAFTTAFDVAVVFAFTWISTRAARTLTRRDGVDVETRSLSVPDMTVRPNRTHNANPVQA
jgi:hypothetical protein